MDVTFMTIRIHVNLIIIVSVPLTFKNRASYI